MFGGEAVDPMRMLPIQTGDAAVVCSSTLAVIKKLHEKKSLPTKVEALLIGSGIELEK